MITLRKANKSDAHIIAALEHAYIDCPWTESQIAEEIERSIAVFYVAECDGEVCGYVSGEVTADECEISNIAVSELHRRKGVGKALLTALLDEVALNVTSVFLMVRDGNTPAIALYQSLGFTRVGLRKNYYKGQDALIMRLSM